MVVAITEGRGSSPGVACRTRFHRKQLEDPRLLWTTAPEPPCTNTFITLVPENSALPVARPGLNIGQF